MMMTTMKRRLGGKEAWCYAPVKQQPKRKTSNLAY